MFTGSSIIVYGKDDENVYVVTPDDAPENIRIIENADKDTFEVMENNRYSKDKNNIYYLGNYGIVKLEDVDKASFVISEQFPFSYDRKNVYYAGKKVDGVTSAGLKVIRRPNEPINFISDNKNLYRLVEIFDENNRELKSVKVVAVKNPKVDFKTFEIFDEWPNYFHDKNNVYYENKLYQIPLKKIEEADRNSFTLLNSEFSKDNKNVYYYGNKIKDLNSEKFEFEGNNFIKDLDIVYFLKNKDTDIDELKEAASRNYSVEITKAVRDTKIEDLSIEKDDFIGLVNGKIKYAKKSLKEAADAILDDLITKNTITAVVVSGNEKDETAQKSIEEKLAELKTTIINGNQENYYYYLYIENKDPNMPEIAILTDSVSDLTNEDIEGLPIKIVPLKIDINGELYKDGVEISKSEFWHEMLDNDARIKTSQPSPQDFLNAYNKLFEKGYKKIISIHPSSKLSGTIQAAKVGRSLTNRENDIELIDSLGASLLQGFLVLGAAGKSVRGESFTEIINWVNNFRTKGKLLMIIPDLKYLEKGGRIGKASSTIAGALNMKPILTVNQGEVTVEKKVLGERNAQKYIEKYIERESKKQSIILMSGWGGTPTELENVVRIYSEIENNPKINSLILNREIGAVIGAHAGPVYGVFIFPRLS